MIWVFAGTVFAFGVGMVTHSIGGALIVLLVGLVLAFVLGTAWMRPKGGSIEHHAPHDRIVNDTNP